jgi:UDP-N-acetylmuramyl pentapeptide phosphotransferase/UDP-N-acetylglucosamine-1-phosphate transferase
LIFNLTAAFAFAFAITLLTCLAICLSQKWHARWSLDQSHGVQKFHTNPTPRVGGVAIYLGITSSLYLLDEAETSLMLPLVLASIPAFMFGLTEDLTKKVGVLIRLAATFASGILAWFLSGISLNRLDILGVDWLLGWPVISVIFTAFAVAGIANAINIVDGFNGLASGLVTISLATLGFVAQSVGDIILMNVCILLIAVVLGFMVMNFPFGKIFMGDGGAYLIGFCLAWVAVLLPMRNPSISPWCSLLACIYPILEVLFSIARRLSRKLHPGHPDRLHFHSLVKTRIVRKRLAALSPVLINSAVSPLIWCLSALPCIFAVTFANNLTPLVFSVSLFAICYQLLYLRLIRFGRRRV